MGQVYELPIHQHLCSNCEHGYIGAHGVFCVMFNELIYLETAADECPEYEET